MEAFNPEEVRRIEETIANNDKLEAFLKTKRDEWEKTIKPLFEVLSTTNFSKTFYDKVVNSQALALSYRYELNLQIAMFLNRRSKSDVIVKKIRQEKFLYYATGFGLKTNTGEKNILVDSHLAENQRTVELMDTHIDFLRDSNKTIESFQFSIKNITTLIEYIGK